MPETILIKKDPRGFVELRLNRPDKHNAFNALMIEELTEAALELEKESSLRFIVLSSQGKSFSAGADLHWMKSMVDYSEEENINDSMRMATMFESLYRLSCPLIGVARGFTLGGGVGLLAVCDYVLADSQAIFGLTEVRLGLIPAVISPYVINKIGTSAASATFTSGKRFGAKRAQEMGLIHEISEEGALESAREGLIQSYCEAGPIALRHAKQCVRKVSGKAICSELSMDCSKHISALRVSEEGQEGMKACLAKKAPKWVE